MEKKNEIIYCLSRRMVIFLFFYYSIYLILGGFFSVAIAQTLTQELNTQEILEKSFFISIAVSGMLCSIQYIIKLYKACITERIYLVKEDGLKRLGNNAYFIFRPLFAIAFSIVMVFGMLSGMYAVTGSLDYILNEKFIYLCVIMSGFIGFSIGKVIDKFNNISSEKIKNIQ